MYPVRIVWAFVLMHDHDALARELLRLRAADGIRDHETAC